MNIKTIDSNFQTKNRIICNPFFLFAISWFVVLLLYMQEWSDKYPTVSISLLIFLSNICVISLIFSIWTNKRKVFEYRPLHCPMAYYNWINKQTKRVYVLLCVDFVYSRSIPFLDYIRGIADDDLYMDFGMPIVHVLVVNSLLLMFYFSSYCLFSASQKRKKFLRLMLVNFLGPLLFMSRGIMLYMLFGLFLIYMMSGRKAMKILTGLIPASILILYLFGMMGNLRLNDPEGKLILQFGGASSKFEESFVPKEFFWSYVYITSPLGNLQNAVNSKKTFNDDSNGFIPLVVNEILPRFISKRIDIPLPKDTEKYLVDPTLMVGTTFFAPFLIWGWGGIIIVFIAIMMTIYFMSRIIPYNSAFRVPMYVVLANLAFFSIFDNMLIFMGLFPQLVFIYLLRNKKIHNL